MRRNELRYCRTVPAYRAKLYRDKQNVTGTSAPPPIQVQRKPRQPKVIPVVLAPGTSGVETLVQSLSNVLSWRIPRMRTPLVLTDNPAVYQAAKRLDDIACKLDAARPSGAVPWIAAHLGAACKCRNNDVIVCVSVPLTSAAEETTAAVEKCMNGAEYAAIGDGAFAMLAGTLRRLAGVRMT